MTRGKEREQYALRLFDLLLDLIDSAATFHTDETLVYQLGSDLACVYHGSANAHEHPNALWMQLTNAGNEWE